MWLLHSNRQNGRKVEGYKEMHLKCKEFWFTLKLKSEGAGAEGGKTRVSTTGMA
jgi:hypothetical protein